MRHLQAAKKLVQFIQKIHDNMKIMVYENWGLEDLPDVTLKAVSGSAVEEWAAAMGKFIALEG